jgi:hypothetical protein
MNTIIKIPWKNLLSRLKKTPIIAQSELRLIGIELKKSEWKNTKKKTASNQNLSSTLLMRTQRAQVQKPNLFHSPQKYLMST